MAMILLFLALFVGPSRQIPYHHPMQFPVHQPQR